MAAILTLFLRKALLVLVKAGDTNPATVGDELWPNTRNSTRPATAALKRLEKAELAEAFLASDGYYYWRATALGRDWVNRLG